MHPINAVLKGDGQQLMGLNYDDWVHVFQWCKKYNLKLPEYDANNMNREAVALMHWRRAGGHVPVSLADKIFAPIPH